MQSGLDLKSAIFAAFIEKVRTEREVLTQALHSAVEAATHAESKAEDAHDTRATEASYLTAGQSKRAAELDHLVTQLELLAKNVCEMKQVQIGAWIELESRNKKTHYLYLKEGGGFSVSLNGETTQIITPQSALGDELQGLKVGDTVEVEAGGQLREYEILRIL